MSTIDDLIAAIQQAGGEVESIDTFKAEHLRKAAAEMLRIADEVDAGSKQLCCGPGMAVTHTPQEDGGVGVSINVQVHFVDVVGTNAPKH